MTDNIQTEAQSEIPQRLYHYTNLESLALILTNKTIRLSPICDMDDPQEARASDVADLGRFVFASSWTDDEGESIPMWNMYASLGAGVRIGLPPMPFKRYRLTAEEYARAMGVPSDHVSTDSGRIESFLHPSIFADGLCSPSFMVVMASSSRWSTRQIGVCWSHECWGWMKAETRISTSACSEGTRTSIGNFNTSGDTS